MFRRTRYFILGFVACPIVGISGMALIHAFAENEEFNEYFESFVKYLKS